MLKYWFQSQINIFLNLLIRINIRCSGNGGVLWKLRKAMYGLKQSPRMWQQHFASVAASLGFERLKSDSNLYFHPERRCYMLCYVDDLLIFGDKKTTEFLFSELQKQLCLRSEGVLEPGTSISFLGRCITRREDSIEMSMPTSYIDKMLEQLDMVKCRHAATPGTDALRKLIDSEELLSPEDHKLYRRIVGQLLWLSSIRQRSWFSVTRKPLNSCSPNFRNSCVWDRKVYLNQVLRLAFLDVASHVARTPLRCPCQLPTLTKCLSNLTWWNVGMRPLLEPMHFVSWLTRRNFSLQRITSCIVGS